MRKHEIPRKKESETRLFIIFSLRSLASTIVGAMIGAVIGFALQIVFGLTALLISVGLLGLIGFAVGTIPIMYIPGIPVTKEIQGEYLYNVLWKYYLFKQRRSLKVSFKEE